MADDFAERVRQKTLALMERLPGVYAHDENSQIYRLQYVVAKELVELEDVLAQVNAAHDIDQATGATLDRFGVNMRQKRGLASDINYRAILKAKAARERSRGDLDQLLESLSAIFICDPSLIEITMGYDLPIPEPAAVRIEVPAEVVAPTGLSSQTLGRLLQQLVAGGVSVSLYTPGTFAFSSVYDAKETGSDVGFDNGTLGAFYDPGQDHTLPI